MTRRKGRLAESKMTPSVFWDYYGKNPTRCNGRNRKRTLRDHRKAK